jgi:AraC-like DNA-binding protein
LNEEKSVQRNSHMPGPARVSYQEVDSDELLPALRFARWRETGLLPMVAEPIDEESRRRFRIRVRKLAGPAGRFVDLTATAMNLSRRTTDCGRDQLDMASLTLFLGTPVACGFGVAAPSLALRPGEIGIKDFSRPATASCHNRSHRGLNLHLPRLTVEAAVGDKISRLHGRVLSPIGLAPMLRSHLVALSRIAPRAGSAVRAAALEAAVDLAIGVLRCELGARLEDEANDDGLFAAAQIFIARHLGSPRLSPGLIARQLRCSHAHLYRVFARRGETVAGYVRERRLRRAYSVLAASANGKPAIGDVAYCCGFENPVHFTHLFRDRFGLTPSALKAAGEDRDGPSPPADFSPQ